MNLPAAFFLLASAIIWNFGLTQANNQGQQQQQRQQQQQAQLDSGFPEAGDIAGSTSTAASINGGGRYRVEGRVVPPADKRGTEWLITTQILVDGGDHIGLLREDGTFSIEGVAPGSHVIEVAHPQFQYETARIDITSKGKLRARKINNIQPALVTHLQYPIKLSPLAPYKYFIPREEWRITDVLLSPMVLMMVLPLVLILILPKMMSDPETRKEMEQMQMPKYEMPEMSEMLTSFFGGGSEGDKKGGQKAIKTKKNN